MVGGSHLYGGFNISPYLALKVFEAVRDITSQNTNLNLSHVDDDNCEICRQTKSKEAGNDAAQPGRSGREWAA